MKNKYLDKILESLGNIEEERKQQFYAYFENAPLWIMDSIAIEKIKKGKMLIWEGTLVDTIYFIVNGIIKATDYRIYGISFDFMLFNKLYAYGGMEVIMGMDRYRTSMQAVTDCVVIKIPKVQFSRWMKSDIRALSHESKLMGEYLLEQARNVRAFLFLQGADRLTMLFTNRYEKYAENGVLKLDGDRQELSEFTGLSVRTIDRSIKLLKEEELITKKGNSIIINQEQYARLKENLSLILSEDE